MKRRNKLPTPTQRTLTRQECADELGLAVDTLKAYTAEGCPHTKGGPGKPNRYDADEVAAWMKSNGKTGRPGRPVESPDIEAAKLREINLRCRKHELDVAEREGRLLDAVDVERGRVERVRLVSSRLLSMGAKMAPLLYGKEVPDIQGELEKEGRDICEAFARGD